GVTIESAELTRIPQNTVSLAGKEAEQLMKMMNILDEHDDVQNVFANFDIEDAEMERILGE
ncbi:MAG TPA: YebC/PmpR family DNA-binding transcriptional regulator, partial [Caldithrix abyssi]|nr:YebC/PmpR family DNA-binding transcriptional regulator [Caldithrix abyssi]